jgi:hypothetical protein
LTAGTNEPSDSGPRNLSTSHQPRRAPARLTARRCEDGITDSLRHTKGV